MLSLGAQESGDMLDWATPGPKGLLVVGHKSYEYVVLKTLCSVDLHLFLYQISVLFAYELYELQKMNCSVWVSRGLGPIYVESSFCRGGTIRTGATV